MTSPCTGRDSPAIQLLGRNSWPPVACWLLAPALASAHCRGRRALCPRVILLSLSLSPLLLLLLLIIIIIVFPLADETDLTSPLRQQAVRKAATMASYVTIEKQYFQTLLRRYVPGSLMWFTWGVGYPMLPNPTSAAFLFYPV